MEEFYRRHVDKVVGFAARRARSPEEVADLTATVFLAVIDASGRYDPGRGHPVSWLLGIAAHQLAAQRRRNVRDRRLQERFADAGCLTPTITNAWRSASTPGPLLAWR